MDHHHAFERFFKSSTATDEFRLLLAPTGLDLQLEQEYLRRYVFPELEALCMARSVTFTDVDLRWMHSGTTPAHLLFRSLDEIDRHAPLVIAIIGSRYGYVPSLDELQQMPELFRRFPALHAAAARGTGLIELELGEGVLNNGAMAGRALFYIYQPLQDLDTDEEEAAQHRLCMLKERIRKDFPFKEFSTLEELKAHVRADIHRLIDAAYPPEDITGLLDRERKRHTAYASSRLFGSVPSAETSQYLQEYLAEGGVPLVVEGEPGINVSLANECARYRKKYPEAFLIEHYVGATIRSTNHVAILRRVMLEINVWLLRHKRSEEIKEVPTDTREIIEGFPFWLGHLTNERLVLVIDGLENLDEQSRDLSWLPTYFQPNVRVVVSANDEEMLEELRERQWTVLPLESPSPGDVMADGAHRVPGNMASLFDVTQTLDGAQSPEWKGGLEDQARKFLTAGTGDFFPVVLQAYEDQHGRSIVERLLSLLVAARRGLTQQELSRIIEAEHEKVSALLDALPPYVVPTPNDLLTIRDSRMRDAVRERYAEIIPQAHRQIAQYFKKRGAPTIRMIDELPWQLEQLRDWNGLMIFLADLENFSRLVTDERQFDLVHYWRVLEKRYDVVQVYRDAIKRKSDEDATPEQLARFRLDVGEFLTLIGKYLAALSMLKEAEEYYSKAEEARESVRFLTQLGVIHQTFGNYPEADSAFCNALRISEENLTTDDPVAITAIEGMGSLLYDRHRYEEAHLLFEKARIYKERLYGSDDYRMAATLNCLGAVCQARGYLTDASKFLQQALDISIKNYGSEHPDVARHYNNLGTLYVVTGVIPEAMRTLDIAYEINKKMLGPDHPETARTLINQGFAHRYNGEGEAARKKYNDALAAAEKYFHPEHPFVATILINLAALVRRMKGEEEACGHLRRALRIYQKQFGNNHPDTAAAMLNLGSVLKQMGKYEESEPLYCAGIPLRIRYLGIGDKRTISAIRAYIDLLERMGRQEEAEEVRREFEGLLD